MRFATWLSGILCLVVFSAARAEVLITAQEAARPVAPLPPAPIVVRGVARPPEVKFETTKASEAFRSPFQFNLKFVAHGGATIKPDTVKVTYLRSPEEDLTPRLRARNHISGSGIVVTEAEAPPGEHVIQVDLTDSQNNSSSTVLKFFVEK